MTCEKFEENLPLLLYGELSEWEMAACEEHLAACTQCRAAREKLKQFHQLMAQRPQVEVSTGMLAEARMGLDDALDNQNGWRALWYGGLPMLRFQPASGFAMALTLILCGFGMGWGLRPHAARLATGPGEAIGSASMAGQDLDNMRISGISRVDPDPQTGGVKITMDAERRVTLEGSLDDPKIQQVLVYAVKSYDNPGIRRDTLDALRTHADNPNIREALIYAMQHDPNAGVRLEALGAVCNMKASTDVRAALLSALEHDTNPGMRVAAVDALIDNSEKEGCDAPTAEALARLAATDSNPYVRLKCSNAMMKSGK